MSDHADDTAATGDAPKGREEIGVTAEMILLDVCASEDVRKLVALVFKAMLSAAPPSWSFDPKSED